MKTIQVTVFNPNDPNTQTLPESIDVDLIQAVAQSRGLTAELYTSIYISGRDTPFACKESYDEVMELWKNA